MHRRAPVLAEAATAEPLGRTLSPAYQVRARPSRFRRCVGCSRLWGRQHGQQYSTKPTVQIVTFEGQVRANSGEGRTPLPWSALAFGPLPPEFGDAPAGPGGGRDRRRRHGGGAGRTRSPTTDTDERQAWTLPSRDDSNFAGNCRHKRPASMAKRAASITVARGRQPGPRRQAHPLTVTVSVTDGYFVDRPHRNSLIYVTKRETRSVVENTPGGTTVGEPGGQRHGRL